MKTRGESSSELDELSSRNMPFIAGANIKVRAFLVLFHDQPVKYSHVNVITSERAKPARQMTSVNLTITIGIFYLPTQTLRDVPIISCSKSEPLKMNPFLTDN